MPTLPLVSIVTPAYNSAQFIERCLKSVLVQDYPNIEHIIQDGASTDETVDILQRYTNQVGWVSEPDKGQADGLNRALQRCRGEIIGVLNADDEYLPHAVSWAVASLTKYPDVAVVYGDQFDVDVDSVVVHKTYGQPYDFEKILCAEGVIPAQAAFIRRSHFEKVGFFADVTRETCPDYEMWVRIGLKFPMQHIPGFIVKYRWHPKSEGRQVSVIPKMVKSKREVLDRTFKDPSTPPTITRLYRRAHSGIVWWGACGMMWNGEILRGFFALFYSLLIYPSIEQVPRLKYYFSHMKFYSRSFRTLWRTVGKIGIKGLVWLERGFNFMGIRRHGRYGPWDYEV